MSTSSQYSNAGFISPLNLYTGEEAKHLEENFHAAAAALNPDSNQPIIDGASRLKPHLLFPWLFDVVVDERIVDAVAKATGWDNIMAWESSFFAKQGGDNQVR